MILKILTFIVLIWVIIEYFIGINVSVGKNIIEMRYVPKGFYIGAIFSSIGMIVLIIMIFRKIKIVKLH